MTKNTESAITNARAAVARGDADYLDTALVELADERPAKAYPGQGSAWSDYLHHRARALRWLRDEMGKTPEQIAAQERMDAGQVRLILMTVDQHPEEYEP